MWKQIKSLLIYSYWRKIGNLGFWYFFDHKMFNCLPFYENLMGYLQMQYFKMKEAHTLSSLSTIKLQPSNKFWCPLLEDSLEKIRQEVFFWARSKSLSSSSGDSCPRTGAGFYSMKPDSGPKQDRLCSRLSTFSGRISSYWFLNLHKGLSGFNQYLKVHALVATVSCNEAKQDCISPLFATLMP